MEVLIVMMKLYSLCICREKLVIVSLVLILVMEIMMEHLFILDLNQNLVILKEDGASGNWILIIKDYHISSKLLLCSF